MYIAITALSWFGRSQVWVFVSWLGGAVPMEGEGSRRFLDSASALGLWISGGNTRRPALFSDCRAIRAVFVEADQEPAARPLPMARVE